ncbi:MAG TPA: KUP/HAK/KT family potassium transporter [Acetobacteraceae bacterium]|nr:KUP/HAK/KT family potassium transporter [Acetobacteraceae bacterium]
MGDAQQVEQIPDTEDGAARVAPRPPKPAKPIALLGLAALGIVFGDIGTSPLYTMKTVLEDSGRHVDPVTILGVLSLLVWTLIIITCIKYVSFAMRIDNDGEGGILALMSLIGIKRGHRPYIVTIGLFGAALIYGDGAITPAISVLSALEGLHMVVPAFDPYVLPAGVVILLLLFLLQPFGTSKIGGAFGPVMLTWFLATAGLGAYGVAQHPAVLVGLSPSYGITFLVHGGFRAFALLGSIFLCVTGAEALYADMGHFGRRPIWLAWFGLVFPALIMNYAGQAAIVLNGVPTQDNIFYRLCPPPLLLPLVILATLATIIASQAIITGAFSMTRQAIQLGWMPRLIIKQTSEQGYGQIYVGAANWLLMLATLGLMLAFRKSDNLSAAYGIAVSATMLMTTGLLFFAMREVWQWPVLAAAAVAAAFFVVDATFFAANLLKIMDGGWVPLALASVVYGAMHIWHAGTMAVTAEVAAHPKNLQAFFADLARDGIARPPGTAVFVSRARTATPPLLAWHVRQNRCLYASVVIVTIISELIPRVPPGQRFDVKRELEGVWRVTLHNGFMERLHLQDLPSALRGQGCDLDPSKVVYYLGRWTILRAPKGKRRLSLFAETIFAAMDRNQAHLTDVLGLPCDQVVETGRHVEI